MGVMHCPACLHEGYRGDPGRQGWDIGGGCRGVEGCGKGDEGVLEALETGPVPPSIPATSSFFSLVFAV